MTSVGGYDIFISKMTSISVNISENNFIKNATIYPNPTSDYLTIDLGSSYNEATAVIRNNLDQVIFNQSFRNSNLLKINIPGEAGVYFIELIISEKRAIFKVVKA